MRRTLLAVFILGGMACAFAQNHTGWQTGKVVSFDSREWTAPDSSGVGTQTRLTCRLVLSVGDVTYTLQRDSPKEKPPKLEVDSPVKYVFDREDILIHDLSGREFRMKVMKRGVVTEAAATASPLETAAAVVKASDGKTVLDVKSNPAGAEIYLNGEYAGRTPSLVTVQSGNYTLRIQQESYMAWQQAIMAVGGKMSFYAELSPQDVVFSEPRGGSVAAAAKAAKKQQ